MSKLEAETSFLRSHIGSSARLGVWPWTVLFSAHAEQGQAGWEVVEGRRRFSGDDEGRIETSDAGVKQQKLKRFLMNC